MPAVSRLNIAPDRSLGLELRDEIDLTPLGVVEDRRFYLIGENDRIVDQLIVNALVQVTAWTDADATVLRLTFPDGTVIEGDVGLGVAVETPIYGRTAIGHIVDGPWAAALSGFAGRPVRVVRGDKPGATRAGGHVSLVTDASVDRLSHHLGVGDVDSRRFRMLIELTGDTAHEEDTWVGRRVALGETVLTVTAPVPRCAMTTHDPNTGERDLDTLRAIKEYRGGAGESGNDLMFGVWAEVEQPGRVRLGDEIRVLD